MFVFFVVLLELQKLTPWLHVYVIDIKIFCKKTTQIFIVHQLV